MPISFSFVKISQHKSKAQNSNFFILLVSYMFLLFIIFLLTVEILSVLCYNHSNTSNDCVVVVIKEKKYILSAGVFAFTCNLLLFAVKLYVGLSCNSISIYSDGINNLFDCLSGALTFVSFLAASRVSSESGETVLKRTQQLLSFVMSVAVAFSGLYFAYSSINRLMYPTPVWFSVSYFWIIAGTTLAKLIMFFVFLLLKKKTSSPIVKVMAFDGILDFFVSSVTVLTLVLTQHGSYAIDAICGLAISIIIVIGAIKLIISSVRELIFN